MSRSAPSLPFRFLRASVTFGLALTALIPIALLGSCASSGGTSSSSPGKDAVLTLHDLRSGVRLTVLNDAYLAAQGVEGKNASERRAAYYSEVRSGDKPKVASNEIMTKMIEYLDYRDFEKYAIEGAAPARAEGVSQTIELTVAGHTRHLIGARGIELERGNAFRDSARGIQLTYNEIVQLQSVPEDFEFEGVTVPTKRRTN